MSILNNYGVLCEALQIVNEECHDQYSQQAVGFLSSNGEIQRFLYN